MVYGQVRRFRRFLSRILKVYSFMYNGLWVLSKMVYRVSGIMASDFGLEWFGQPSGLRILENVSGNMKIQIMASDFELLMSTGFQIEKMVFQYVCLTLGNREINGRALYSEALNGFSQVFGI
ncbi:hypothetical protein C1646_771109 [Rhizophagus diaphanus]|nr:hypothetical protein C1646_771109 [Rhizophagus diaphanus] [Rhizophagus sp. MUCL 43196]